jgi:hypothetical protein
MAVQNVPHDSAYWRDKADEVRARADEMRDYDAVQAMLQVAQIYERMARRAAEHEERLKPPSLSEP